MALFNWLKGLDVRELSFQENKELILHGRRV